ncbi:MAG TPA: NAD-dependent epimerase/dehydratase family protein [Gemmatimonadaceae bacterium]|nr:NAD-dependent epimerase/dehydratase family protein [Gemmatimonadaceae bacterium]
MPSVLVTGANGFLGSAVCRTLLDSGFAVRGLTRTAQALLQAGVVRYLAADLTDSRALAPALEGVGAVIHLAGRAHIVDTDAAESEAAFQHANVDGTEAVLEAALRAGVGRFLFTSSIKVMGAYAGRPWSEEDIPRPTDAYGRSKLAAEELLRRAAQSGKIEVGIIRLPLVYGPGVKANMLQLFKLVEAGVPLPFRDIANRRSVVFSGNVADALLALLVTPTLKDGIFFVTDALPVSTPALVQMIGRSLNKPVRLFSVPAGWLRRIGRVGDSVSGLLPLPVNSPTLDRLTASLECSPAKIETELGFRPRWSTQDGIGGTAQWYCGKRSTGN